MSVKLAAVIKKYGSQPQFLGVDITDLNQAGAVDDTPLHLAARPYDDVVNVLRGYCGSL